MPDELIPIEEEVQPRPVIEDDDAEPEGAVEVQGRRMVDVSVVAAERKRARELAEKHVRENELAPLQEKANKADALQQALNAAQPYVDLMKQHPELLQTRPPTPPEQQIPDDEAAQYARDFQLYTADSKLDVPTAKKIMARHRTEMHHVAREAAREAMEPVAELTAKDRSARNFQTYAQSLVGEDGQLMADPQVVVDLWKTLPAELTQHEQVAEIAMDAALGRSIRQKHKGRVPAPAREPVFSETSGGRAGGGAVLTENAKKLGLTDADMKAADKKFVQGGASSIGEW